MSSAIDLESARNATVARPVGRIDATIVAKRMKRSALRTLVIGATCVSVPVGSSCDFPFARTFAVEASWRLKSDRNLSHNESVRCS